MIVLLESIGEGSYDIGKWYSIAYTSYSLTFIWQCVLTYDEQVHKQVEKEAIS